MAVALAARPAARPKRADDRYGWQAKGFAAPALVLVAIVLYLPFLWTGYLSFTKYTGVGAATWVGLDNYRDMFGNPDLINAAVNTLYWVVGTIALPVGLGLAIALLSHGLKGSFWYRLPFLLPYAISGVAVGIIWTFILQTDGALTEALQTLHLPGQDLRWLLDSPLNTWVMIIATTWQGAGVNALLFGIGLASIPHGPVEAARIDGASGWSMFRHIYWPMLRPLTTVVVGLAIVGSLKTFDVVWAMTKGGPGKQSETLALRMWKATFQENQWGTGAAIAVFLTVITVLAAGLYLRRQLSESKSVV
ncbi:carbohydrate ABC transporter permease [Nakamurella lactea]|uniref:carbohydrate ABC transporter permease n=1 Tax=Nakamurella lactea TaxID=459515 RepID=UPI00041FA4F7|nr:sugar ABC transporter permease [Nakamurella lactea]